MELLEYQKLIQDAVETAVFVSSPMLGLGLIAGLFTSIFQAATQISDPSLAFIPKMGAMILGLVVFGNFMFTKIMTFTIQLLEKLPLLIQ